MAAKQRAAKAGSAARAAGSNPYVQRIVQDAELRQNVRDAFEATKSAYGRLANGKGPSKALLEDKKLQKDLREAATSLRDVGTALKEGPRRRKKRRLGRMILLAIVGGGLALALSEGLRSKVLDALFGAEEEFDYTSTSTPSPTPDSTVAA
jgi:hypothetical protein